MDWGKRIKQFRARMGMTQEAFAEYFGVDRTTVSRWERGIDEPALVYRRRILALTGTVPEQVIGGLVSHVEALDGLSTLVDANFRVMCTTTAHQQLFKYNFSDVYGKPSQPYWSVEMQEVVRHIGGLEKFRSIPIRRMDLSIVRQPHEGGFGNDQPVAVIGHTVAIGERHEVYGYLTTMRVTDVIPEAPLRRIESYDGPINLS